MQGSSHKVRRHKYRRCTSRGTSAIRNTGGRKSPLSAEHKRKEERDFFERWEAESKKKPEESCEEKYLEVVTHALQWSYRLRTDGPKSRRAPLRCASRRRKLVEGNRFITMENGGERYGRDGARRRGESGRARGFARVWHEQLREDAAKRCCVLLPFPVFCAYARARALCYSPSSLRSLSPFPRALVSLALSRPFFFSPYVQHVDAAEEPGRQRRVVLHTPDIPRQTVPMPLSPCVSSASCLLRRNLVRSRAQWFSARSM